MRVYPFAYWQGLQPDQAEAYLSASAGLHANVGETSAVLAIDPGLCDMERVRDFVPELEGFANHPLALLDPVFLSTPGSFWALLEQGGGVWGNPSESTAEQGEQFLQWGAASVVGPRARHGDDARPDRAGLRPLQAAARVIRIGLLGGGFMGASHAASYRALGDRVRVKTVGSRRSDRAVAVAESLGAELTDDLDAAIRDPEVDAVDVCLPTPLHREAAEAAFAAGKHVLLEKPIALTLEDADAIVAAAERSGRLFMVGLVLRFWPEYVELQRRLAGGELGRPLSVSTPRLSPPADWNDWMGDPAQSGGVPVDLLIHDFDQMNWLLGTPRRVFARAPHPDHVHALVEYDGATGSPRGRWRCRRPIRSRATCGCSPRAASPSTPSARRRPRTAATSARATRRAGCGCTRATASRRPCRSRAPTRGGPRSPTSSTASAAPRPPRPRCRSGSDRVGEAGRALERPTLQASVDQAGGERVARTGRVDGLDARRRHATGEALRPRRGSRRRRA